MMVLWKHGYDPYYPGYQVYGQHSLWEKIVGLTVDEAEQLLVYLDVNRVDQSGNLPLDIVNSVDIAKLFVKHGAKTSTALVKQMRNDCDIETIRYLLTLGPHENDPRGWTALHYVHNRELAELLIDHGFDVNALTDDGNSVLYTCLTSMSKHEEDIVRFYLEQGLDPDLPDADGWYPIHICTDGSRSILAMLEYGANPNIMAPEEDDVLTTVWHKLMILNEPEYLIDYRPNPTLAGPDGHTPLHRVKTEAMMKALLYLDADVNAQAHNGETPIMYQLVQNRTLLVEELLNHGADPNLLDDRGHSALCCAKSDEAVKLLLKHGADVSLVSGCLMGCLLRNGCTPIDGLDPQSGINVAQDFETIEYLIERGARIIGHLNPSYWYGLTKVPMIDEVKYLLDHGLNERHIPFYYFELSLFHLAQFVQLMDLPRLDPDLLLRIIGRTDNPNLVKFLLDRGYSVNGLMRRVRSVKIAKILVSAGVPIDSDVIDTHVRNNNYKMVEYLLKLDVKPSLISYHDMTNVQLAKLLWNCGQAYIGPGPGSSPNIQKCIYSQMSRRELEIVEPSEWRDYYLGLRYARIKRIYEWLILRNQDVVCQFWVNKLPFELFQQIVLF